jgi:hypothetical protein
MSDRVIRGYWLTSGVKFLRTSYSPEQNERLLGALPKPLRASLAELQPVQWCPRSYHTDMLNAVVSAHRDESAAFDSLVGYGQLVGADLAAGILKPLLQIVSPKLLVKKLPLLWSSEHQDDGRLDVDIAQADEGRLPLRLSGLLQYEHVGVVTLGWIKGLLTGLGRRDVTVRQTGWSLGQPAPVEINGEVRWS